MPDPEDGPDPSSIIEEVDGWKAQPSPRVAEETQPRIQCIGCLGVNGLAVALCRESDS